MKSALLVAFCICSFAFLDASAEVFNVLKSKGGLLDNGLLRVINIPLTQELAKAEWWVYMDGYCEGKLNSSIVMRNAFVMAFYNNKGIISGVEVVIAITNLNMEDWHGLYLPYQNPELRRLWVLRALFENPEAACKGKGRTQEQLDKTGVAPNVWIVKSNYFNDSLKLPNTPANAIKQNWEQIVSVEGIRYFFKYGGEGGCQLHPVGLLFDEQDQFIGFGFVSLDTPDGSGFQGNPLGAMQPMDNELGRYLKDAQKPCVGEKPPRRWLTFTRFFYFKDLFPEER